MKSELAVDAALRGRIAAALAECNGLKTSLRDHLNEFPADPPPASPVPYGEKSLRLALPPHMVRACCEPCDGSVNSAGLTDDTASEVSSVSECGGNNHGGNNSNSLSPKPFQRNLEQERDQDLRGLSPLVRSVPAVVDEEDEHVEADPHAPFYIADLGEITRQYVQWRTLLPRIEPWYAMKCNPTDEVVGHLLGMGTGIDCASRGEIAAALKHGVDPSRIIYANPCKPASHLRYAREHGVSLMTFDNEDELRKVRQLHPNAKLVLRILVDDSKSICRFGVKFGAPLDAVPSLLAAARRLSLDVVGVSFHVGSGCTDVSAFRDAVERARGVFDEGARHDYAFTLLDVGGGFPGNDNEAYTGGIRFSDMAATLGAAVDEFFPDPAVRVIAEPGRYFVSSAFTLSVSVTSRRIVRPAPEEEAAGAAPRYMYYINDGVYGAFNCILFDHYVVCPRVLTAGGAPYTSADETADRFQCSVWGPTCDSMDCVMRDALLPCLEVGDWLCFPNMGAYTTAAASDFNGFRSTRTFFVDTEAGRGATSTPF